MYHRSSSNFSFWFLWYSSPFILRPLVLGQRVTVAYLTHGKELTRANYVMANTKLTKRRSFYVVATSQYVVGKGSQRS